MKQSTLIRRLARESGISKAAAADQLDLLVSEIMSQIRMGRSASIPGLGSFHPCKEKAICFSKVEKGR